MRQPLGLTLEQKIDAIVEEARYMIGDRRFDPSPLFRNALSVSLPALVSSGLLPAGLTFSFAYFVW